MSTEPTKTPDIPAVPGDAAPSLRRYLEAVREVLQVREGRRGDKLDQAITFRDLVAGGVVKAPANVLKGGGVSPRPGVIPIEPVSGETLDLTPPPSATGLTVTATLNTFIVQWDAPTYTAGGGHAYTEVYGASYSGTPPLPTFGNTILLDRVSANLWAFPVGLGRTFHFWIKHVTKANVAQVNPTGGTNGVSATTGKIGNTDLGPLIISADKLSQGAYAGVNMVPNGNAEDGLVSWALVEGGTGLSLTADTTDKTGGAASFKITKSGIADSGAYGSYAIPVIPGETYSVKLMVRGASATGTGLRVRINQAATNPAGGYVTSALRSGFTDLLANGAITVAWAPLEYTYQVPAGVFYVSVTVAALANSPLGVWFDDVQMGRQITASHIAAGSIAVGSAAIANGAISNAMIANAAIDSAKIADASIVTAKIGDAQITSAKIASLDAGKITTGTLDAGRIAAGSITAGQINSRGLTIQDANGNLILAANQDAVSNGNMLLNSGFEQRASTTSLASGWGVSQTTSLGSNTATYSAAAVAGLSGGGAAQRLDTTAITHRAAPTVMGVYQDVPASHLIGDPVTFSASVAGTAGFNLDILIEAFSAANSSLTSAQRITDPLSATPARFSITLASVPANTAYLRVVARLRSVNTVASLNASNATANGTTATVTHATQATAYAVGSVVEVNLSTIAGVANTTLNGLKTVTASTTTSVSFAHAATIASAAAVGNVTQAVPAFFQVDDAQLEVGSAPTPYRPTGRALVGFDNPITASNASTYIADAAIGNAQIGGTIQSDNYVAGSSGWAISKGGGGSAEFYNVTTRGSIRNGAYTAFAWPAAGAGGGFYLGPEGLLLGSFNDGKYLQVSSSGDIYSPGFNVVGGSMTVTQANVINTLNIAGQAVTIPASTYTEASISAPNGTTLQTCTISSSGAQILVTASSAITITGTSNISSGASYSGNATLQLLRNGVVIASVAAFTASGSISGVGSQTQRGSGCFQISDTPGAGSHTYTLVMAFSGTNAGCSAASRSISLLETKR